MAYNESKKACNDRYLSKFHGLTVRLPLDQMDGIRAAADAAGESLAGFVAKAAIERAAGAGAGARTPAGLTEGQRDAAEAAAEAAGVPVEEWLTRAISGQVQRDQSERALRAALTGRR